MSAVRGDFAARRIPQNFAPHANPAALPGAAIAPKLFRNNVLDLTIEEHERRGEDYRSEAMTARQTFRKPINP